MKLIQQVVARHQRPVNLIHCSVKQQFQRIYYEISLKQQTIDEQQHNCGKLLIRKIAFKKIGRFYKLVCAFHVCAKQSDSGTKYLTEGYRIL